MSATKRGIHRTARVVPLQNAPQKLGTRSSEVIAFEAADGGKTANYLLRWTNTKGETGPWSVVTSATIPAV